MTKSQLPKLTNKCYYLLAGDKARNTIDAIQQNLTAILGAKPRLILIVGTEERREDLGESVPDACPIIALTNLSKVAITCPHCNTTYRAVWNENLPEELKGVGSFTRHIDVSNGPVPSSNLL